jgi:hypothetical protein
MFTLLPRTFFADDAAWNQAKVLVHQNVDLKS